MIRRIEQLNGVARIDLPREKLAHRGVGALSDTELLAVLLGSGVKGSNVLSVAHHLIRRTSLRGLTKLSLRELSEQTGIGKVKASQISAAIELGRRLFEIQDEPIATIEGPESVFRLVRDLSGHKKEHFIAIYLNAKNQVQKRETVSIGSLFVNMVHPREVFAPALEVSAAAVVLAHNHPSGDPEPSPEDQSLTARLVEAGKLMGIEVLDHVIVGQKGYVSFQERGWI